MLYDSRLSVDSDVADRFDGTKVQGKEDVIVTDFLVVFSLLGDHTRQG